MLSKQITLVAALALATSAIAEPMPYKPMNAVRSTKDVFGLAARGLGYTPHQVSCGLGKSCDQACGAGFATCKSDDRQFHCFDAAAGQTCCSDGSGNSCDKGYYCTASPKGDTYCCPDGQDLKQCAAAYHVSSLSSESTVASTATSSEAKSFPTHPPKGPTGALFQANMTTAAPSMVLTAASATATVTHITDSGYGGSKGGYGGGKGGGYGGEEKGGNGCGCGISTSSCINVCPTNAAAPVKAGSLLAVVAAGAVAAAL